MSSNWVGTAGFVPVSAGIVIALGGWVGVAAAI